MAILQDECGRSSREGVKDTAYTGVDPDGEIRECAECDLKVKLDPEAGKVVHLT